MADVAFKLRIPKAKDTKGPATGAGLRFAATGRRSLRGLLRRHGENGFDGLAPSK